MNHKGKKLRIKNGIKNDRRKCVGVFNIRWFPFRKQHKKR